MINKIEGRRFGTLLLSLVDKLRILLGGEKISRFSRSHVVREMPNEFTSSSLTSMNLAANQYSKQQTNQVHSAKFKQARIVSSLLNITTPRVTYEKYASWFLDVVVVLILRVWTSVFYFPVKHSRPYKNCGYSRGCKYDFYFLFTHF